jgi:hypothetical protein
MQKSLFPTKLVIEQPYVGQSKMLKVVGFDQQDRKYAVKFSTPEEPEAAMTEWVCYNLCELLGIPHPDFDQVIRTNGETAFGSRWDENSLQFNASEMTMAQAVALLVKGKADTNSIATLDHFLPNPDRHLGNYLFRTNPRATRIVAFDWSQSTLFNPWPAQSSSVTIANWRDLRGRLKDRESIRSTIEALKSINPGTFESILTSAHPSWCTPQRMQQLLNWWSEFSMIRASDTARTLGI